MLNVELPGTRKTSEKIHGRSEGGYAEGWCDRRRILGIG